MNEKYTENQSEILEEMSEASARHFGSLDAGFLQTPGQTLGSAAEDTNSMDLNREKQVIHQIYFSLVYEYILIICEFSSKIVTKIIEGSNESFCGFLISRNF